MANLEPNRPLDYGVMAPEYCDPDLRRRALAALMPPGVPSGEPIALESDAQMDVRRYIMQLEDALLRHHWGGMPDGQIAELLKCATGLDIEGRSRELMAMASVDA